MKKTILVLSLFVLMTASVFTQNLLTGAYQGIDPQGNVMPVWAFVAADSAFDQNGRAVQQNGHVIMLIFAGEPSSNNRPSLSLQGSVAGNQVFYIIYSAEPGSGVTPGQSDVFTIYNSQTFGDRSGYRYVWRRYGRD